MKKFAVVTLALLLCIGGALALSILVGPIDQSTDVISDARFYNALGYKLAEEGNLADAQTVVAHAVELDPAYENARANLAVLSFQLEDYETAIAQLRVLSRKYPENGGYRFDLAQNLVHQARYKDADLGKLREAAELFEELGDYPNAANNAAIVRLVIAEFS